jgi:hypothetical protein
MNFNNIKINRAAIFSAGFVLVFSVLSSGAFAQNEFKKLSSKERIAIAEQEEVQAATDMNFQGKMQEGHDLFKERHYLKAIHAYEEARNQRPYNVYPKVIIADIELSMKDTLAVLRAEEKKMEIQKPVEVKAEPKPEAPADDTQKRLDEWEKKEREKLQQQRENKPKTDPAPTPTSGDVPKMNMEDYRKELAQKYPNGVTETVTTEGNKVITQRVIVKDGKGDEFRKVEHSWGGVFFFKNGEAVPERVWKQETER